MSGLLYVNALLGSTSGDPAPLTKTLNFPTPLMKDQSRFVCAVSRLTLPLSGSNVPMWIPTLELGGDGLDTIYKITITQGEFTSGPVPLRLVQQVQNITPPVTPLTEQPTNEWAFIYDLDQIAQMLTSAATEALGLLALAGGAVPPEAAISFQWNPVTSLFTATMSPYAAWEGSDEKSIFLFFSATFAPYLSGWQVTEFNRVPSQSAANGYKDILLVAINRGANWLDAPADATSPWIAPPGLAAAPFAPRDPDTALLIVSQTWPATYVFNALASVRLSVAGLANTPEYNEPPQPDQSINPATVTSGDVATILTDFVPDIEMAGAFEQTIVYAPEDQTGLRWIELGSSSPVTFITISAFWVDQRGTVRALFSARESQVAAVKLAFAPRPLAGLSE